VLDRPLPNVVADLDAPIRQAAVLKSLATATAQPRRYVELGSVLQLLGDGDGAGNAYDTALLLDPSNVAAKAGLALVEAARGGPAQQQGAARLRALAAANPRNQLVAFNEGWLAIYRREADPARAAWTRTVALGEDTRLGRTAAALLASLENGTGGRNP
jgi:cytochrome c-type biogenesis protein CcmH/NrfG